VIDMITMRLFFLQEPSMHISENCIIWGYGEQNPHQDCRKVESHEV